MKLGRNVARTFLDYYKLVGYISAKPSSSISPKSSAHSTSDREKLSSNVQLDLEEGRYVSWTVYMPSYLSRTHQWTYITSTDGDLILN